MYHSSCQQMPHPTACQGLRVSSLRLPSTEVVLSVLKQGAIFCVTLSSAEMVSRLEIGKDCLLGDKTPKRDFLLTTLRVSSGLTIDLNATFDCAAKIFHEMHRDKTLEHDDYLDHLEMINHFKDGLDVVGLETYLHLADLTSIVKQCQVYQVPEHTLDMWSACWGAMLKMIKGLQ